MGSLILKSESPTIKLPSMKLLFICLIMFFCYVANGQSPPEDELVSEQSTSPGVTGDDVDMADTRAMIPCRKFCTPVMLPAPVRDYKCIKNRALRRRNRRFLAN